MLRLFWCAVMLVAATAPIGVQAREMPLFATAPAADSELAAHRGGFQLPGGVEVALAATITTDVDGVRLLQTVLQLGPRGGVTQVTGNATATIDTRRGAVAASLPGLSVEHFVGERLGSVIMNSGDNRVIDNQVSVDLSLRNVQPLAIGSALFRIQSLGIEAGIMRATGG